MSKFNIGDTITPKPDFSGFKDVTIIRMDAKFYYVKVLRGIASIPKKAVEETYQRIK